MPRPHKKPPLLVGQPFYGVGIVVPLQYRLFQEGNVAAMQCNTLHSE